MMLQGSQQANCSRQCTAPFAFAYTASAVKQAGICAAGQCHTSSAEYLTFLTCLMRGNSSTCC
jgi:hypothetical protein